MATHVELYRALEPHVGTEAAQLIADVVPPAADLATKQDIESLRSDIHRLEARIFRWGLVVMAPTWGAMVALAIRG